MKLEDLFHYPQLSLSESTQLLPPSPSNIEGQFKVGQVVFDNVNGKGATPNNQNVIYMGFAMELKPSQFLDLAVKEEGGSEGRAQTFIDMFEEGTAIASPFLIVDIDLDAWEDRKDVIMQVKGHEGRGRMVAVKRHEGDVFVPVHVFPRGLRARHFSEEFFEALRNTGLNLSSGGSGIFAERSAYKEYLDFGRIFWNGKTL